MSRFQIGQRVRVSWVTHPENSHMVGIEGVVTAIEPNFGEDIYGLDAVPLEYLCDGDFEWVCGFCDEQLEPIIGKHMPCEEEFKRDLDRLLEREGIAA